MDYSKKITAIIQSSKRLELVINQLYQQGIQKHFISINNTFTRSEEETQKNMCEHPRKEVFLTDDFGWVLGLSIGIPVFISLVIGIFLVGDVRSLSDNIFYGIIFAIIGTVIGLVIAKFIKTYYVHSIREQEKKGGFCIWITITSEEQIQPVLSILNKYRAQNIKLVDE